MAEAITIKNLSEVLIGLTKYEGRLIESAVYAMAQTSLYIEQKAKEGWSLRHPPGTKTTATPGGKPASITGNLRRSIHTEIRYGFGNYVATVGPSMVYAAAVEFGGSADKPWANGGYPYMVPTYNAVKPDINRIFTQKLNQRMRG